MQKRETPVFRLGGDLYSDLLEYQDKICHVRIDNPATTFQNRYVASIEENFNYDLLFKSFEKICYNNIIPVEVNITDNFEKDLK